MVNKENVCSGRDLRLQQDSLGGAGGCGCGSVEEGELCELTCGSTAVKGDGTIWHREERVYLIRAHYELIHMNSLRVLQTVHQGMVSSETSPNL